MAKKINFKIIVHEGTVFEGEVDAIYSQGVQGRFGVLPDHIPFMSALEVGITKIEQDGKDTCYTTMGGVFQIKDNEAMILTDIAECGSQIDVARAKAAKERAEARLRSQIKDKDYYKAQFTLAKALARLKAAMSK